MGALVLMGVWLWPDLPDRRAREWTRHVNKSRNQHAPGSWRVAQFTEADWDFLFREMMRPDSPREQWIARWIARHWNDLPAVLQRLLRHPQMVSPRLIALQEAWETVAFHPDERRQRLLKFATEPGTTNQCYAVSWASNGQIPSVKLLPDLARLATDGDLSTKCCVVHALQIVAPPQQSEAIKMLSQLTNDFAPVVRELALMALQRLRETGYKEVQLPVLPVNESEPFDLDAQKSFQPVGLW